jgi:hypothetical protein
MAIPNYLEKHFKEKAALKKQREMMGDTDELRQKIEKMQEPQKKMVNTSELKAKR